MLGVKRKKEEQLTFFKGTWVAVELIGQGSYGKVYKAKKEEFGISTYCAIKRIEIPQSEQEIHTLKTEGMTKEKIDKYLENSVQKWVEEIKFMSIFKDSTNVVNIEDYEVIPKEKKSGYIIHIRMELLTNLDDYAFAKNITDQEVLKMAIDVCSALEDCEKNQIVHRDIKPDNIFVNKKGIFKVGDFGIAKQVEGTLSNMSKKGTENYMAPELYKNEKGNKTVDIYSLGIMLYRFFNYNRLPFLPNYPSDITYEDREQALTKRISNEKMKPPINAKKEIADVILKACSYYPKDRYQSAKELKEDLEKVKNEIVKPAVLFHYDSKKMDKIYQENTARKTHDATISIFSQSQKLEESSEEKKVCPKCGSEVEEDSQFCGECGYALSSHIEKVTKEETKQPEKKEEEIPKSEKVSMQEPLVPTFEKTMRIQSLPKEEKKLEKQEEQKQEETKPKEREPEPKEEKQSEKRKIKNPLWVKIKSHKKKIFLFLLLLLIILLFCISCFYQPTKTLPQIETLLMPDVVGKTSEVGTEELKNLNLEVEYSYYEVEDLSLVGIIREQSIASNTEIQGGTLVVLTINVSSEKVTMISVVGLTDQEAIEKLKEIGLKVNVSEQYDDTVEAGKIISQMIPEGEELNKDSTVELLVSLGKMPEQEQPSSGSENKNTPKPTPTPTGKPTSTPVPTITPTPTPVPKPTSTPTPVTPKTWSDWLEQLPSGVNSSNATIETKTEYRYRTKSTTTSSFSNSLKGWTLVDTKTIKEWGTEQKGTWNEKTYQDNKSSSNYIIISISKTGDYSAYAGHCDMQKNGAWQESLPSKDGNCPNGYILHETNILWFSESIHYNVGDSYDTKCSWTGLNTTNYIYLSGYTYDVVYKKATVTSTYYFEKWSDWSNWSSTSYQSTDTREVQSRTLYRYLPN